MERIVLVSTLLSTGLVLNLLSNFRPMVGRRTAAISCDDTRLLEVAPDYEGWYQDDGRRVQSAASADQRQIGWKFQDEEDQDWNLEDGDGEFEEDN